MEYALVHLELKPSSRSILQKLGTLRPDIGKALSLWRFVHKSDIAMYNGITGELMHLKNG